MLLSKQFLLFTVVGAVGTAAHYIVLIIMVQLMSTDPLRASIAGFAVGALVNYYLNYLITFKSNNPHCITLPKFFAVALVGLCLNILIMALMTSCLHYLLSQALATVMVLAWNFFFNRFWTFKEVPFCEIR